MKARVLQRLTLPLLFAATLSSCCVCREVIQGTTKIKDSVRVEVRTKYIERLDTVYIELPSISDKVITQDTTSLLENEFAVSRASILGGGRLYHSLETKPAKRPVAVKTVEIERDSTIYKDKEAKTEIPVIIEKPLSRFVKAQIAGFWVLLAAALLWLILKIKKI